MTGKRRPTWLRRRIRDAADEATIRELTRAMAGNDERRVHGLLHRSATVVVDGGGRVPAECLPGGRSAPSADLVALMTTGTTATLASINGVPGITLVRDGRVAGVITAEVRSGRLLTVWVVCNPEKLRHWNR